ncbi:SLATT domain-containing protein [Xenorhabdus sp. XENO-10]|uniref:SLATT domain-containing protein n=1 Tax=Xenorhabdus yunnanensis TaxID=3025878 RepID=A0ABT5LBC2_9GAMM|nr:SLATT domain-containing protein [Xenorhabdus yunnanensis]MDC9588371.1 SLATT domain-containing protein [Xenorhabdus yunnanensis]
MTQTEMLKVIARYGYNVGFGAKKNFATYDIICKASGWISFISLAIGILALFIPQLATNIISAILILFGVATMYIQFYDSEKKNYESAGIEQTKIFNELEVIYRNVRSATNFDYDKTQEEVNSLMTKFYNTTISKQIFGSNWYAHYKFFCELEKDWVEDELKLTIKDKILFSFCFFVGLIILTTIVFFTFR